MRSRAASSSSALRYLLSPGLPEREAIRETVERYLSMREILRSIADREGIRADVVRLQRLAYETIRSRTGLPAQMVLLGIRDFAAVRTSGEDLPGVPLDEKLYSIKSPTSLTLATVRGRITLHFDIAGYSDGWRGPAPARLVATEDGFEIVVGVKPILRPTQEKPMGYEGILSRVGRLVAGLAHAAIDRAEQRDPIAVVEQAIRDIDREAEEARAALGKHTAEQHRLDSRSAELRRELASLADRIATALHQGREDLAKAGIERQIDIEAQIAALHVATVDVKDRIQEAQRAVQAVIAARREGEAHLADLKRSLAGEWALDPTGAGPGPTTDAEDRAIRSLEAISRVTGVPASGGGLHASEMNELERLHRNHTVEERLAALKAKSGR